MADREKLIELVGQVQDCGCDVTDVVEMNYVENSVLVDHLIADGVTVRERGRWLYDSGSDKYFCPARGENALSFKKDTLYGGDLYEVCLTDFCPNCGADMRGEEDGK